MWIEASQPCNRLAKLKLHLLLREENLYAIEFGASSLSRNLDTISRVLKKTACSYQICSLRRQFLHFHLSSIGDSRPV